MPPSHATVKMAVFSALSSRSDEQNRVEFSMGMAALDGTILTRGPGVGCVTVTLLPNTAIGMGYAPVRVTG
jgi:hypothetical protein